MSGLCGVNQEWKPFRDCNRFFKDIVIDLNRTDFNKVTLSMHRIGASDEETRSESDFEAPAVSVIIPAYNRGVRLAKAVRSVLAQTFHAYEIIIVNDASVSDPIPALGSLALDPRIHIIRHERNLGAAAARNTGIRAARGRFVAFLDSDDEWDPAKLVKQHEAACGRPDPDRVFCVTQSILLRPSGRREVHPLRGAKPGEPFEEYVYVYGGFAQTSSFFVGRALALATPFREELRLYEDHLFFIENCQAGADYIFIDSALSIYHAEHTEDRLSFENDILQCRAYLRVVEPLFTRKAKLAFDARYLARLLIETQPGAAFCLFARALTSGALRLRFAASFLLRLTRLRA